MLPKEHGAWNGLFIGLAAGWIGLGRFSWAALAVSILWLTAFSLRGPWNIYRQYRNVDPARTYRARIFLALLGLSALAGIWGFVAWAPALSLRMAGRFGVPLGLVLTLLIAWNRNLRFPLAEVLGFSALTLATPVLYLCGPSHDLFWAFWLWGFFGGYFLLSLAGVKIRQKWLEDSRRGRRSLPADRLSQGWWVILLYALWVEALGDTCGGKLILMAAPLYAALRALAGLAWGKPDTPMMRLGILEMVHSILFTSIWAWTWSR
ncbi:MAG TPA: YwiC-like family protein [bacterium]|nr:YwiC-like family protein [bacterium]